MTSTVITRSRFSLGPVDAVGVVLDITSYATGGESVSNSVLGLEGTEKARIVSVIGREAGGEKLFYGYDLANAKLKATTDAGAEVVATTDIGEVEIFAFAPKGGK